MKADKGLTLVEVIVVIFLLFVVFIFISGIHVHPSRETAKIMLCSNNLKQQAVAMWLYANDNGGNVYTVSGLSSSPRELVFEHTRLLKKNANIKTDEIYSCPSRRELSSFDNPRLWQYSLHIDKASPDYNLKMVDEQQLTEEQRKADYRYMDYFYLLKKDGVNYPESDIEWVSNIEIVKNSGEKPLIIDVVARDLTSDTFFDIDSEKLRSWGMLDNSNHRSRKKGKPSSGNHAYVDGHVSWVEFDEMTENHTEGNQAYYWKK